MAVANEVERHQVVKTPAAGPEHDGEGRARPGHSLPDAVARGTEPFLIIGALAGG